MITALGSGQATQTETEDESYTLDISQQRAMLVAPTVVGVLRGLETLLQLVTGDSTGYALPAVHIEDAPRFAWRGLMLDSARHYQSPEFIRHFIDWMALHKLNVLHWHLTDDPAWRLEIRKYPKLTLVGAWRVPAGGR